MDTVTEPLSTHGIDLDRDDVDLSVGERDGDRTKAGADLHDQLTRLEVGVGDQTVSELGTEEVLTETATAFVPGRPPVGGHDGSPW